MEKKNMTKIAVVGVDGSGKTVMMAAMGEMYESPDADGYFLSAEDSRTFHNVKALVGRMRGGAWPGATDVASPSTTTRRRRTLAPRKRATRCVGSRCPASDPDVRHNDSAARC